MSFTFGFKIDTNMCCYRFEREKGLYDCNKAIHYSTRFHIIVIFNGFILFLRSG